MFIIDKLERRKQMSHTTSDMRGECDEVTRRIAISALMKYGITIREDKVKGADIVAEFEGRIVYIDVERSSYFNNGVYYSPRYSAISIPERKREFLKSPNACWMCIDEQNEHFILMEGDFILKNSFHEKYEPKNTGVTEEFIMIPHNNPRIIIYKA
jgi:hypothetical protein